MAVLPDQKFDAIVVGSGPGGASVARELARRGWRVLVLEQGSAEPVKGTVGQMARFAAIPGKGAFMHRDASLLIQGINAGGSSTLNFATAADPPLALFQAHGVDLAPALAQLRAELPIGPLPDALIGPMAASIMTGARSLGLDWRKLDKMIRPALCRSGCWRCTYGCPFGAKWSARDMLDEALRAGAVLLDRARVLRVISNTSNSSSKESNGGCSNDSRGAGGVDYMRDGQSLRALAPVVVLAGGGIGSPRLLHASGLAPRSATFFSDPVVAVMGVVEGMEGGAEVPMAAGLRLDADGVTLADMTLPKPLYQGFAAQAGRFDRLGAHSATLTLMVKIADQIGGAIGPHWVDKTLRPGDKAKLAQGVGLARDILAACGARQVFKSWHFAAHPGGSVRIGEGVDSNLQSALTNLYVCDASVIPGAWGLPPTLTLLSLGVRLGQHLAGQQSN